MRRDQKSDDTLGENPRKNANCLSVLTFWFTLHTFYTGRKRDLEESDLTKPLAEHKSSYLGNKLSLLWSREVQRAKARNKNPSMLRVLWKCFYPEISLYGITLVSMELVLRLCQPFFVGLYLRYFDKQNSENKLPLQYPMYLYRIFYYWTPGQCAIQESEAYVYAFGIFFCTASTVMVLHPCMLAIMHMGMKMRVACCSLIYRKALRINLEQFGGKTVGNVVNLISNDVNRFDMGTLFLHYLWIGPLQTLLVLYFISRELGVAAFIGMSGIVAFIPLQVYLGLRTAKLRRKTAIRTDDRVRQMNEIILGMQVIKMYAWENAVSSHIYQARRQEIRVLKQTSFIRGILMSFLMFIARLAIFLSIMSYVLLGNDITAEKVFFVSSLYQILRTTMTAYFPAAIAQVAEAMVAISRIKAFLLTPETDIGDPTPIDPTWRERPDKTKYKSARPPDPTKLIGVKIENAYAKYDNVVCLTDINLDMVPGKLTACIGQVGAGKTCLLNLILGELHSFKGSIDVNGVVSYACQEPWLFAGSVRQNILFGQEFDRSRYNQVISACALVRDFKVLPYADKTIVGEKGISLSGGQRARVNLARAVYRNADIYLLDDPLSAVDTHVGKHLFERCINGFLKQKVVILVTHQLQYLQQVHQIIIMDEGVIQAKGSYNELQLSGLNFAQMLEQQPTTEEEADSTSKMQKILTQISMHSVIALHSAMAAEDMGFTKGPVEVGEMRTAGAINGHIYKEYLLAGGNWCRISVLMFMFIFAQFTASGGDYFLSQWVKVEDTKSNADSSIQGVFSGLSRNDYILIYTVIILITIGVSLLRSFYFFTTCMRASINLHNRMFHSICRARMRFFNTNTSGRILNRFSKDLGAIDEFLPNAMIDCFQIILNLIGVVIIVSLASSYLLIPTAIILVLFCFLRQYYLYTSRSIKRLEGITRSPVFSHLNASLQGLTTIRSHGQEMILVEEFDKFQDIHSSAWYMFITTSKAFGYWLDCICALFIGAIAVMFLITDSGTFGGSIGLAITQCMGLTGLFQWGMRQSAEMENQMTSVERVLEFTQVEHEPELESEPNRRPALSWPDKGRIEFINAVMRYNTAEPPVLKNLNFVILPMEKVGIVGRTGAGKSSLISALFRLAYFDGQVIIDGIDIAQIGLHDLRKKLSIIPQEPVLFHGTLRYNLDPFKEYDDHALLSALVVVEFKCALTDGMDCLDHLMTEGGANISVGQRQLICLARAIVRNNVILIMDEATANVDPQTDKFIQTTIRTKFQSCTVLTIAHRLHTVMDSDRILVMDFGIMVEFDHPYILLQNKLGFLSQMVEKTGPATSDKLHTIAKQYYQLKQKNKSV